MYDYVPRGKICSEAWIFVYSNSPVLRAKATSLEGYVTKNSTPREAVEIIEIIQSNIGTKHPEKR